MIVSRLMREIQSTLKDIAINQASDSRRDVFQLLGALSVGKIIVFLYTFAYNFSPDFLNKMSTRWDTSIYQTIATQGYTQISQYAFSPVYPTLIKGLNFLIPSAWVSALIITNIISFIFPIILYKTFGFKTAFLAVLFPTYLVYTTIPYSDVIVLVFLAFSIFFLLREKIIASSLTISMAIVSSFHVAWVLPSFVLSILKKKRIINLVFGIVPFAAGVIILLWFKLRTGDFFKYFSLEKNVWSVRFGTPLTQVKWLLSGHFTSEFSTLLGVPLTPMYWLIRNLLFEAFYLVGAVYLLFTENKQRVFLFSYCVLSVVPLLFVTGIPAISIPRLLLPAFPIFFGYTTLIKKDWHYFIYLAACLLVTAWVSISQTYSFFA